MMNVAAKATHGWQVEVHQTLRVAGEVDQIVCRRSCDTTIKGLVK